MCSTNQSPAIVPTCSSAPGSSNECVAPRDDVQPMETVHASRSSHIQIHRMILASDNQQRRSFYLVERTFGQIWAPAARHHCCDFTLQSGCGDERSRGPRTCPKEANRQFLQVRLAHGPLDRQSRTLGEQRNVKTLSGSDALRCPKCEEVQQVVISELPSRHAAPPNQPEGLS
jgi:hypothetical protein